MPLIAFFTDFGVSGPYVGQMELAVRSIYPEAIITNLMSDAPECDPKASAYLLAALADYLPDNVIVVCVVDPGVGSQRLPILLESRGQTFIGPDNGLLSVLAHRRSDQSKVSEITWRAQRLSMSFHGRDLFAPIAARCALSQKIESAPFALKKMIGADWPDELGQTIYIDHYGNVMTGLCARSYCPQHLLEVGGRTISYADTFSSVPKGQPFWYENSIGLIEIAQNCASFANSFGIKIGMNVSLSINHSNR